MQLVHETPDFEWFMRAADGRHARVSGRELRRSFIVAPDRLIEDWGVAAIDQLTPEDLDAAFALDPEIVLIGCGERQAFLAPAVQAACLTRGVGVECMTNAAAARTFNVLASEGRRVVAGFILDGEANA